ncbi:MAG: nucleoside monophosphate kinase [Paracoccus sp. (in: a-proteobacteria)]|uniref:nucleoside monophosphate kinase n=1 Tax=Paracoccus sp. TaxID=267 RepID=UPI00391B60D9
MTKNDTSVSNTLFIEVSGAGLAEVDGLYMPSTAPPAESESGTLSSPGFWNGKPAWDRADGKAVRSPAISYSNSYASWRISRLDGHLAYELTCDDALPPTDRPWNVYKMGIAPAPSVTLHHCDPRLPTPQPNIVFVLGGPGAGKGTMCDLAQIQLGWTHLSAGDLLRAELKAGGPRTALIRKYMDAGLLVPDDITAGLLRDAVEQTIRRTGNLNFLIDGFPRSFGNLAAWHAAFGQDGDLPKMIYFECPLAVLTQRILGRAQYSGRSDDNIDSIKLRFDTFKAETLPIVEHFKRQGKCEIINTGQDRQTVYGLLRAQLADQTDAGRLAHPLSEKAAILLGLRPYPNRI